MNIPALTALIIPLIQAGLTARGLTAVVKRDQQPRQVGVPTGATIFLHHIGTRPYGFPARQDVWNTNSSTMVHTETQFQWSRFQISGLAPQSPATPTAPIASDYVRAAALTLQSETTCAALLLQNVGVLRISDISSTYFEDDKGQNEENPSFDVLLGHQDILVTSNPVITNFDLIVGRI